MRNAILLSLIGIILISIITVGVVYALPEPNSSQSNSSQISEASMIKDSSEYPYLLRSYDGKLAVFTSDLVQPDLVFDVYIRSLPEYDRNQLERGIRIKTYEELTSVIEDYIS